MATKKLAKKITKKTKQAPAKKRSKNPVKSRRAKKLAAKKVQKPKVVRFKFNLQNKIILKAIKVLKELNNRQKGDSKDLMSMNEKSLLYLTTTLNSLPKTINIKPVRIQLVDSLYEDSPKKFCFIVSNEFKQRFKQELKDPAFSNWKFLSFDKLRRNFKTFQEKRDLLEQFELFFCEGRVYMLIKKMLGKIFYSRKKYPYPVEFNECLEMRDDLEEDELPSIIDEEGNDQETAEPVTMVPETVNNLSYTYGDTSHIEVFDHFELDSTKLEKLLNNLTQKSCYFYQGNGPEYTLKVSRISDDIKNVSIVKNLKMGVKHMMKYMIQQGLKLKDIRRISLKLAQSVSLPIYSYLKEEEIKVLKKVLDEEN